MDKLPTTTYAVMGMLDWGPRSPYDLALLAEQSIANFWNIAKSQIYNEADRLEELGYVAVTEVEQDKRPDKKILALTREGEKALDAWLAEPTVEPDRFRSAFLVKVMFGHRMPQELLKQMLESYRDNCRTGETELTQITEGLSGRDDLMFARATARLGLKVTAATREWAEETLDEMEARDR